MRNHQDCNSPLRRRHVPIFEAPEDDTDVGSARTARREPPSPLLITTDAQNYRQERVHVPLDPPFPYGLLRVITGSNLRDTRCLPDKVCLVPGCLRLQGSRGPLREAVGSPSGQLSGPNRGWQPRGPQALQQTSKFWLSAPQTKHTRACLRLAHRSGLFRRYGPAACRRLQRVQRAHAVPLDTRQHRGRDHVFEKRKPAGQRVGAPPSLTPLGLRSSP